MAKSNIIKELANNEIALDIALKRLLLLANDLADADVISWVEKELSGYWKDDVIPEYRILHSLDLSYTGVNGNMQVKNMPLPLTYLSKETRERVETLRVFESIANIVKKSAINNNFHNDLTLLAGEVYHNTRCGLQDGVQCLSIQQNFQASQFQEILDKVGLMLLNTFMKLEKQFGNLDSLDIDTTNLNKNEKESLLHEIKQIIHIDNITVNNNNFEKAKIKGSNLGTENKIDNKKDKKKIKDSNTGKGSNSVNKTTTIKPTLEIPLNKIIK